MTSPKLLVHRLVLLWVGVWLFESLAGLASTRGSGLFRLDALGLFAGDLLAFPGIVLYALGHSSFPELWHLFFNGWLMWIFGPEVEALYRGRRLVRLFVVSLALAALLHLALAALAGGIFQLPVLGCSGLVMTVIAVQAAVYPDRSISLLLFRCRLRSLFLVLVVLDAMGLLYALSGRNAPTLAYDIHLVGAAVGWFWAGGHQKTPAFVARWLLRRQKTKLRSSLEQDARDEAELDRILAKIGASGLGSLNAEERLFLERRSGRKR